MCELTAKEPDSTISPGCGIAFGRISWLLYATKTSLKEYKKYKMTNRIKKNLSIIICYKNVKMNRINVK